MRKKHELNKSFVRKINSQIVKGHYRQIELN